MRHARCSVHPIRSTSSLQDRFYSFRLLLLRHCETMTRSVRVRCAARLHLGFLDLHGGLGRQFGSIGLALDSPTTTLSIQHADTMHVEGPERDRIIRYLDQLNVKSSYAIRVESAIPSHSGLGSGTQLALALSAALRKIENRPSHPREDAALLDRGARSGIGVALFEQGGFVMDGGRGSNTDVPPMLLRMPVPDDWRFILILDDDQSGLAGSAELAAFADLPPMTEEISGQICRQVAMGVLPALAEGAIAPFGAAITQVQRLIGDYFAPAQGGRFASPRVAEALDLLHGWGAAGIGQSSWGPAGFGIMPNEQEAERLAALLRARMPSLKVSVQRALNQGAQMEAT
ncbi:Beta-ribofuranosylaminobenzene 5'-phosphate synthase [Granulibacter bethesdensis CGDNIH4]|nr:Beta-ribofuranosylaminobenzene 5'-phosphate synthase [Granulibacter bethesdensis CGDNIH4]